MKKTFGLMAIMAVAFTAFSASAQCYVPQNTNCYQPVVNGNETSWNCDTNSDNCNQQAFQCCNLPQIAQNFVNQYYTGEKIATVKYDKKSGNKSEYKVKFASGQEVTFDNKGNWKEIEAPYGYCIPDGIAPEFINKYLVNNFPTSGINELEKEGKGYEVGLTSGQGLLFSSNGTFVAVN